MFVSITGFIQVCITTLANLTAKHTADEPPRKFFALEEVVIHIHTHLQLNTFGNSVIWFACTCIILHVCPLEAALARVLYTKRLSQKPEAFFTVQKPHPVLAYSPIHASGIDLNEFRCYEAKIEGSEKAGSCRESNPGHLWLEPSVLCH